MASIVNPLVTVANSSGNSRNVTVTGTLNFDASDVGRTYKLEIGVYGDDSASDNRPSDDSSADDLIYTFKWTAIPFPRPYKNITVLVAGNVAINETRSISNDTLDEDKGIVILGKPAPQSPVPFPRSDEIYAKVTLGSASISKNTPPLQVGIGV
ncbi:hypothetical protein [Ideonella sp. A 288]|uniref:hypothetical protein n=1 Tax=Ideonella sp. A 288 TaxID=1962181 RepID=UPI000B4B7809|nr:hypothetical protein [Ideonella sp. A 288]